MSLYFMTGGSGTPAGSANLVYATPDGSRGSASLRALAAGDFPVLNSSGMGGALHPIPKRQDVGRLYFGWGCDQ